MVNKRTVFAFFLTIVLTTILLVQIPIENIPVILFSIEPIYIALAFLIYTCSYFFRAVRFRILLKKQIRLRDLLSITCVHNMLNSILPVRTGELSYIYLINKKHGIAVGDGIVTLLVARVFDFIVISMTFLLSALLLPELPQLTDHAIRILSGLLILLVILLVILIYKGESLVFGIKTIIIKLKLNNLGLLMFLVRKGNDVVESFSKVRSSRIIIYSFILSILIWSLNYSVTYILVNAMKVNMSFWGLLLGITSIMFLNLFPVPSLLGLGTNESVWTIVFMALGMTKDLAITSGFSYHILIIIYYMLLGFYGLLDTRLRGIRS